MHSTHQPIGTLLATATLTLALALASFSDTAAGASKKFYKWVDKDGVVHYSATPPKGQKAELITTHTARSSTPAKNPEAQEAKPSATEALVDPAKDPALCQKAQRNLKILQSNQRIRLKGEDGELTMLSQEQKDKQVDAAQKVIKRHCGR